jgi:hypothetical protein
VAGEDRQINHLTGGRRFGEGQDRSEHCAKNLRATRVLADGMPVGWTPRFSDSLGAAFHRASDRRSRRRTLWHLA